MAWVATAGAGISGEMVRDMMLECVERRFDAVRAPQPVQWLADNGSAYSAAETVHFATALNLVPCFTPVRSPESNGVCEAFVKTFKRDYVRVNPRPDEPPSGCHLRPAAATRMVRGLQRRPPPQRLAHALAA